MIARPCALAMYQRQLMCITNMCAPAANLTDAHSERCPCARGAIEYIAVLFGGGGGGALHRATRAQRNQNDGK